MIAAIKAWWQRYMSTIEAGYLTIFIVVSLLILSILGNMLAPLFASIVIAYVLDAPIKYLQRCRCPKWLAVNAVFIVFVTLVVVAFVTLVPLLSKQFVNFAKEMPSVISKIQVLEHWLVGHVPYLKLSQINTVLAEAQGKLGHYGQTLLKESLTILPSVLTAVVYLIMVPLLVYFFLSGKEQILAWCVKHFVPKKRDAMMTIWTEIDKKTGNYIRGKIFEALIVAVVTYIAFIILGLEYSLLLAALVGLSVIIPYIGAIVVTIPVMIVGLLQWGWTQPFLYLVIVYTVIVALDANLLVPLLFSEAVSLHPIVIIIAVLVFGGIWGFWGVFFAIPLAALVKALMTHWPIKD